ncbi:class I adenylate-forming enzyme family protein [Amycolatopsis sp. NBC_01480]|uniref:class I adenylate-forming enzyme family protein n=1 Tax=Amycolatopsis sp. NBC_01480 TaxID=2903562 RepID=UPI002E2A8644|nr:class I adenylate-forming enzyme family protein [Amycolatopsis sp. NBC_01480]
MGEPQPWLSGAAEALATTRAGLLTEHGRYGWPELLAQARVLAADLPPAPHGWVVPSDGSVRSVIGLLAVGLADPAPRWVLGDPGRWGAGPALDETLWPAAASCVPPDPVQGPSYATATSGTTGEPRLLFGAPAALPEAVRLYTDGMPEYAGAEVFAACSALDFAAAFYMTVIPAVLLARDLVLFAPHRWDLAAGALDGRAGICLAAPVLAALGGRAAGGGDYRGLSVVPAGGGLTAGRAERISAGFTGCSFLSMLGSTETGLLTVGREVREDGHVGSPLPGKPVWLTDIGGDGVGTLWTKGPDTRLAASDGRLLRDSDGAVSTGDLAHLDAAGTGYFLDGRSDDLIKVDGVSVYPNSVAAAVRALPGVLDAAVSVDRDGPADRIVVKVVGETTEDRVRATCGALPQPVVPHRVTITAGEAAAYSERGKVLL